MIRLYDDYTHLTLDRRGFMDRLARLAGSSAAASLIAATIAADSARAAIVAADDPRLTTGQVSFPGASGTVSAYRAAPAGEAGPLPGVIVVHENRGLNEHIRDVARRLALEGFVALAVDFLSPAGGTPPDEDAARRLIAEIDRERVVGDGVAAARYLRDEGSPAVAAVGFCWGGGMVIRMATVGPDLAAVVSYYGSQPAQEDVPRIRARLLLHYAGLDERINAGIPAFQAALDAAGTDYRIHLYEGANHAFNNDTSAARYDKPAAELAWSRTVAFLKEALAV